MTAEAITGVAGAAEPPRDADAVVVASREALGVESARKTAQKRPQRTAPQRRTGHAEATAVDENEEKSGAGDEAPDQAGVRLASHLDMLAETVRAIVTRVMQPQAVPPPCETGGDDQAARDQAGDAAVVAQAPTPGRTEYSLEVRERCVAKHAAGLSYKTIATELGMPMTSVQTIVKRAKQHGGVVAATQRAGRPRATDESVERTIREIVAQHPQWSAREVLDQVMASHQGIAVSFETIRRRVRDCRKQLNETTAQAAAEAEESVEIHEEDQDVEEVEPEVAVDIDMYSEEEGGQDEETNRHEEEKGGGMQGQPMVTHTEADTSTTATPFIENQRPVAAAKARRKRGTEYSPEFREICVHKHEKEGKSYQAIATELDIPPDSVRAIVRKAKRTGSVVTAPRSGRPRKTTDLIDRVILQSVKNSQRSTAKQIQDDLWTIYQVKVSCETIRRRVRDHTKQRLQLVDPAVPPRRLQTPLPAAASQSSTTNSARRSKRPPARAEISATAAAATTTTETSTGDHDNSAGHAAARSLKRKRSEYPVDVREKCVALHREGLGYRKIGERLNMPHTTVRAIVEKVQRTGSILPAPRSGRPRKTDEILDKVILQTVKANAKCSARMIQQELESAYDVKVSCETIRRRVKDHMRQKHLFADAASQEAARSAGIRGRPQPPAATQAPAAHHHQQQQDSILMMAEMSQSFLPVHHGGAVVTPPDGVRTVPQSLMEMMTAAAAAAAAVSTPESQHHQQHQHQQHQHQHQHHHQQQSYAYPPPPHQLPLMPAQQSFMENAFGFAHQLHQPHEQHMQAMIHQAMGGAGLSAAHHAPPQARAPPASPPPLSEFVLM